MCNEDTSERELTAYTQRRFLCTRSFATYCKLKASIAFTKVAAGCSLAFSSARTDFGADVCGVGQGHYEQVPQLRLLQRALTTCGKEANEKSTNIHPFSQRLK